MTRNTIDQAWFDRLERLTTPRLTRYIAHRPTPPQTAFLLVECREAMYGGAAGGGKSDALLMAALQNGSPVQTQNGTAPSTCGVSPLAPRSALAISTPRPTSIATSQRSTSSSALMRSPSFPSRSTLICSRGFDGSKAQACR